MTKANPTTRAALPESALAFLSSIETGRRLSGRTVAMYRLALEELAGANRSAALEALEPAQIRRAIALLMQRGQAARSIAIALAAWRGYFRWLAQRGLVRVNPAAGIRAPRAAKPLPKALAPDVAVGLVDFTPEDAAGKRDRAMFELLYSSGLRLAELVGLDARASGTSLCWLADDLDEVTVTGKGRKQRVVPVGRRAAQALRAWLEVRGELARPDEPALFVGSRGGRISPSVVQRQLRVWAVRQGVPAKVHPHMLRHSFASHVLQSSGDLRAVQEMLGHASISTTQVYTKLDFQHLAKVYDATHPRAKKK